MRVPTVPGVFFHSAITSATAGKENGFRVEIVDSLAPSETHVFHPRPSATAAVDAVRSALNQYEMAQQFAQSRPGPATL